LRKSQNSIKKIFFLLRALAALLTRSNLILNYVLREIIYVHNYT
jgi:hypothetical protein